MNVRVRFAPSPTGSLHLGNALSAIANRAYADDARRRSRPPDRRHRSGAHRPRRGGGDPRRSRTGSGSPGRKARSARASGPSGTPRRPRSRSRSRRRARRRRLDSARRNDARARRRHRDLPARDGRRRSRSRHHPHHPRLGSPAERGGAAADRTGARRRAAGGDPPRPSARRGRQEALQAGGARVGRRPAGRGDSRPPRCAPTSTSSGCRATTSASTSPRIHRLAIDAIAEMPDADLAAAAGAPVELARALRGARTLVEAREIARQILEPDRSRARRGGAADAGAVRRAPRLPPPRCSTRRARARSCAS